MNANEITPSSEIIKSGEIVDPREIEHCKDRIRGALRASYAVGGHIGSRKLQLMALDALAAMGGL